MYTVRKLSLSYALLISEVFAVLLSCGFLRQFHVLIISQSNYCSSFLHCSLCPDVIVILENDRTLGGCASQMQRWLVWSKGDDGNIVFLFLFWQGVVILARAWSSSAVFQVSQREVRENLSHRTSWPRFLQHSVLLPLTSALSRISARGKAQDSWPWSQNLDWFGSCSVFSWHEAFRELPA